jgi:adenylate kinase
MAFRGALIFLGPPGAGKGTQSRFIAKSCGVPQLSTGDMFRKAINDGTETGRLAKPIVERGELVPDEIVMKMVEERLVQADCGTGFVFDGFPRTLRQAERLNEVLRRYDFGQPVVVDFKAPRKVLIRRLSGRWTCSVGGETYNVYVAPPNVAGICDVDGGKLFQRPDDRPEVIGERLLSYERQTKPLAEYYRRHGDLEVINAAASAAAVSGALQEILDRLEWRHGEVWDRAERMHGISPPKGSLK